MDESSNRIDDTPRSAKTYALSLKGDGITVEREVDEMMALEVLGIVMSGGDGAPHGGGPSGPVPGRRRKQHSGSLREYMDEVNATRNVEKILTIANFIEKRGETVTRDAIKTRFRDAAEPVPGNYPRDFRWTVKNGWLARVAGSPGEFYVTEAGHNAIEERFSAEIRKKTGVAKGRRGGRRRASTATEE